MTKDSGLAPEWIRTHYREYLQTEHWQDVRRRFAESKLGKHGCFACGSYVGLNLHHKSYKRVGRERLTDLIYLCADCHSATHELLRHSTSTRLNTWNAARRIKRKFTRAVKIARNKRRHERKMAKKTAKLESEMFDALSKRYNEYCDALARSAIARKGQGEK